MLTWLKVLFAVWSETQPSDTESEGATWTEVDDTGTAEADHGGGGVTDGAATPERDGVPSAREPVDESSVSKRDVHLELGLSPAEFLVWVVRDEGGQAWQGVLVEKTGWPKSTVSRYLSGLESDGALERISVGRRKLVCVPGELPEIASNDSRPGARCRYRD